MYPHVTIRFLAVAACGWLLAVQASALSLGRARGAALLGRPLSVSVPVTVEAGDAGDPCASAEVFYGDSRVAQVTSRWEPESPTQGLVRVQSSAPIDEPAVIVYLKVGCRQASTRRYVFLAEPPPEDEPAARTPATRAVEPVRPSPQVQAPAAAAVTPRRREQAPAAAPAVPREPVARAPAAPLREPRARRKEPEPQARLKLEPLDLSIDRDPVLRLSPALGSPANVDARHRAGLSALWQALQKPPEESAREALRLQGVERELDAVRAATRQNAAQLAQLRAQADRAQGERQAALALVLALGAVVLALLAWMGWRWYRARELEQVGRWFDVHGESVHGLMPTAPDTAPAPVPAPRTSPAAGATAATGEHTAVVPSSTPPVAKPAARPVRAPVSTWGAGEEFQSSRGGTLRMVGVQELIDVHDKADFFLSIGETEQAVAVLEAHVHDQVETGALAWMDLLELYHSLGRRADFERLRAEFRQRFTAQVPDFEHFDQPTAPLENYGRALSRIVELWPSRRVLDVIEESIFRRPHAPGAEPFGLEAYRELVLLYHIARDMQPQARGDEAGASARATNFRDTSLQPLHVLDRPAEPPLNEQERLMIPPPSARLGVDIDLGDPESVRGDLPALDFDISTFDPASRSGER